MYNQGSNRFSAGLCAVLLAWQALLPSGALACTSILVTRAASSGGATMISYSSDAHDSYGELVLREAHDYLPGAMRKVVDWDSGKPRGEIPQTRHTYSVVSHINEHQVVIAETTFGGRKELLDPESILDYGSLMFIALERAATAREAIQVMTSLATQYGFGSGGESFSIADPKEVWILEMVGKGPGAHGAIWAAQRLPDGVLSAHANQARIRKQNLADPDNALLSPDAVSFARAKGYFRGADKDFSFADAYAPLTYDAVRLAEARVWSVFRRVAPRLQLSSDYVRGVPGARALPLWVKPDKALSVHDVMELMRDHFEGTSLDMRNDVGAGPHHLPYRWRPLTWKVDGKLYAHERAISTQQTAYSFVSQSRDSLPSPIGGVLWFGVDDSYSTVYSPIYAGIRKAPPSLEPNPDGLYTFSWQSAFWVFNWVANFAYSRYDEVIHDVREAQQGIEGALLSRQSQIESAARAMYARSPELAKDYLTNYSVNETEGTVKRWRSLGETLLVKFLDGNTKAARGSIQHPPYPDDWYRRIVAERGAELQVRPLPQEGAPVEAVSISGYFHSREELGLLANAIPDDFPFGAEKLALVRGDGRCVKPPSCCAAVSTNTVPGKLLIREPSQIVDKCEYPDVFVRLSGAESRPLVRESSGL